MQARLDEIERCLEVGSPLAVVFLVGSTLEGLLMQIALAQAPAYANSPSAPKVKGRTKELTDWTLDELITVWNVLGEDHGTTHRRRHFRNHIHPCQQMKEGSAPRVETALIAQQVVRAAIADLEAGGSRSRSAARALARSCPAMTRAVVLARWTAADTAGCERTNLPPQTGIGAGQ